MTVPLIFTHIQVTQSSQRCCTRSSKAHFQSCLHLSLGAPFPCKRIYRTDKALAAYYPSYLLVLFLTICFHLPFLLFTVLTVYPTLAPLNIVFLYPCLFSRSVALFLSASQPQAFPSTSSIDTCGDCVLNGTLIRFTKGKAAA